MNTFTLINSIVCFYLIIFGVNATIIKPKELRIAGGKIANNGQFPFFAQLVLHNASNPVLNVQCGASLIHPQWLLSAAHCFSDFTKFLIQKGVDGNFFHVYMGTNIRLDKNVPINYIKKVYIHPKFYISESNSKSIKELRHDVAVLFLEKPYALNKVVQTISLGLPPQNFTKWLSRHRVGITVGIGLIRFPNRKLDAHLLSKYVMFTKQRLISFNDIKKLNLIDVVNMLRIIKVPISDQIFTLSPFMRGHTMRGDSGGPLIVYSDRKPCLYGTTSFGGTITVEGEYFYFGAFQRIDTSLNFICKVIDCLL